MIEKVISGKLLDDGDSYSGYYEVGVFSYVKDENDGKTYIVCFPCDNGGQGIPWNKGQYLILRGILRYSGLEYDELDVQEISVPFMDIFHSAMEN